MLHQLIKYIQWYPKTFHLHGIHSPFIYTLEKTGLRKSLPKEVAQDFKKYRETARKGTTEIEVQDFGAGSRVFKSNKRNTGAIARHAGASLKRMHLLYQITDYFKTKNILELGTSVGLGTMALARRSESQVTTIEGCPETAKIAQEHFALEGFTNIKLTVDSFENVLPTLSDKKYDLIYFDGNHSKDATLRYAKELLPTAHNNSIWVFDDIHWSTEMTEAWREIQQFPEVTATIDGYWFGIVFFRKEQRAEEFQIRL